MKRLAFVLLLASCTTPQPKPPETQPTTCGSGSWCHSKAVSDALDKYGKNLLAYKPKDAEEWCPKWDRVGAREFYIEFVKRLSYRESGWQPSSTYTESFSNSKGERVVSTGLTQVSYESCRGYGVTGATTDSLKGIEQNLECAIRILDRWIVRDGYIAKDKLGCGRYFSVCRPGSSKAYIQTATKEFCR